MRTLCLPLLLAIGLTAAHQARADEPHFSVLAGPAGDRVSIATPAGTHVNDQAPLLLQVHGRQSLKGDPRDAEGNATWHLSPALLAGETVLLDFAVCDEQQTWCEVHKISFVFDPHTLRQAAQVAARSPAAPVSLKGAGHHPGLLPFAIQDDLDAAFARATDQNKLVLMDFHAVWCPPCQALAAEGMADPGVRALVDQLVVVQLDADNATSWNAKSRYVVRGYPTVILARANGQEVSRLVGYPGVAELTRWLEQGMRGGASLQELAERRAGGDRSAEVLTGIARALTELGLTEEAAAVYAEALPQLTGPDALDARLSLLGQAAEAGDRRAVKAQLKGIAALEPAPRALWTLYAAARSTPDGADKVTQLLIDAGLNEVDRTLALQIGPAARADALEARALLLQLSGDDPTAAFGAAADTWLEALSALPGDRAAQLGAFRGPARSLTDDLYEAGRLEEAEALHTELTQLFAEEVTYYYDFARFLAAIERPEEAQTQAALAVSHAHGDNLFWATGLLADLLAQNGKTTDAIDLLTHTIDDAQLPDDPTIRTHRYVKRLEKQLETLKGGGQASL